MKSLKLYIIIAGVLMVFYLLAQYNQPQALNWDQTLSNTDKIPFGTYILYNQITDIFPKAKIVTCRKPIYNVINDHDVDHGTYIIICRSLTLNEYDYSKLKQYILKGNDVFISALYFGDEFSKKLKTETANEFGDSATVKIKFSNQYLDTTKLYHVKKGMADGYFRKIDSATATILGTNTSHHINFIKYKLGKGNLYLNAAPLMFTNYAMLNKNGMNYASVALSYLKNDANLIWDQYYTLGREDEGSSMRVFLRNPSLRWAFYITFFSLILYVLYQIKRRQRIIPIIEPLQNTTLDFVKVVGQVYYEQRDNSNIAQKKAAYFLEYLRAKYNLKTTVLNDEFGEALAHKSGVETTLIKQLLNQVTWVRSATKVSDHDLIQLNKNIEQFYLQSR
ncbi:hypothetical protein [Mucilaginibacter paludis]|uniref:DUF4350 domain-containing protein n=1 Tax=Mucilaginibacter paludis DSM 18603 TaxID=714943 RepID=H1Y4X7_9SPHI|nr:hypothetical protein [Mucilaginibacter paludis]EHQ28305.1 hypothetical protein Mucpa_4214 [Mucilaginibacter paludis DSM 18603]